MSTTNTNVNMDYAKVIAELQAQLAQAKADAEAAKSAAAKVGTLPPALLAVLEGACTPGTVRPLGDKGNTGWNFSGRAMIGGELCQIGVNVIRKGGAAQAAGSPKVDQKALLAEMAKMMLAQAGK